MPQSALNNVQVDYCLPIAKMSGLFQRLAHEAVKEEFSNELPASLEKEVKSAKMNSNLPNEAELVGKVSAYSCPPNCSSRSPPFASSLRSQRTSQFGHAKLAKTRAFAFGEAS
jgi:hypothetical protein